MVSLAFGGVFGQPAESIGLVLKYIRLVTQRQGRRRAGTCGFYLLISL